MDLFAIKLVLYVEHNICFTIVQVLYPLVHFQVLFRLENVRRYVSESELHGGRYRTYFSLTAAFPRPERMHLSHHSFTTSPLFR